MRLPTILNGKTVDPQDGSSPKVMQLETAMGAAIELFAGASAIVVPRDRFAPVKKCSDLMLLRSDAYRIANHKPVIATSPAPIVDLDSKAYKLVGQVSDDATDDARSTHDDAAAAPRAEPAPRARRRRWSCLFLDRSVFRAKATPK